MIYMQSPDGKMATIVLTNENLEQMRKGRPAVTPDKRVAICWTPDLEWVGQQIMLTGGDATKIAEVIDRSLKRPVKPIGPYYPTSYAKFSAPSSPSESE